MEEPKDVQSNTRTDLALQQGQASTQSENRSQVTVARTWASEPDGPNDREIEIWYNKNWVPAYFSDLKKGDMFLDLKIGTLDPGRCFGCASDVRKSYNTKRGALDVGPPTFSITGLEILQAPEIKDIEKEENEIPRLSVPSATKSLR